MFSQGMVTPVEANRNIVKSNLEKKKNHFFLAFSHQAQHPDVLGWIQSYSGVQWGSIHVWQRKRTSLASLRSPGFLRLLPKTAGSSVGAEPALASIHGLLLWKGFRLSCGETAAVRAGVHLATMHRHVAFPLLHSPPVLLLRGRRKKGSEQTCVTDSCVVRPTLIVPPARTHLDLGSAGLLVKAHGHGVAGYPEEVCQRHRFPLRTERALTVTRAASAWLRLPAFTLETDQLIFFFIFQTAKTVQNV